jgi:hypothetical protein
VRPAAFRILTNLNSVLRLPRERIRDITAERFAFENTSLMGEIKLYK